MCGKILKKRIRKKNDYCIVETTATIIREDIISVPYDLEYFSPPNQFLKTDTKYFTK
jgi:hypothetical protein